MTFPGSGFLISSDYPRRFFIVIVILCMLTISCGGSGMERTTVRIGEVELQVEVARTRDERTRGLMFREDMGRFDGMLFVFQEDQHLSFWMKNTLIPLSIAYISSDGTIREIYDMKPESLESVPSVRSVRYALEVRQGFFGEHDIVPGDRVEFPGDFRR